MHVQETLVREIMRSPVVVIEMTATIEEAQALMEEHNVRRLPVVDSEGRLVGIVSQGDLREASALKASVNPYAPEATESWLTVEEIMTPNPITVTPDTPIWQAAELMIEHKIGGLPVMEGSRLVGIVTTSDIMRLVVAHWRAVREQGELAEKE